MLPKTAYPSTPVPQLLQSNAEPSNEQILAVYKAIRSAEDILPTGFYDNDKSGRQLHAKYASFIHDHKALLSAIRRVPVEIWEHIFRYVAGIEEADQLGKLCRLGEVCRLWKEASKSVPELLGTLPPLTLTRNNAHPTFIQSLERYLSKIPQTQTMSLCIRNPLPLAGHPALSILYPHSQQWKTLSISLGHSALGLIYDFLQPSSMRNLTTLKIYVSGTSNDDGQLSAFADAPMLTDVDIDCLCHAYFYFPWAQLKRYKERSRGNQIGLSGLLRTGDAIEHLEYRTGDPGAIVDVRTCDRPTLTRLKSIDIRLYHGSTAPDFPLLDQFTAPYLETIKIKDHGHDFLPFLLDFIQKCVCGTTLTSLIFFTSPIKPGDLTKVLLCTPVLAKLECNDIPFVDLCMFSVRNGGSKVVPLLHDLVVHTPSASILPTLEELASSRSQLDSTLEVQSRGKNADTLLLLPLRPTQQFSLKLVFSSYRQCREATEKLIGPQSTYHSIRSVLSDNLVDLDIRVDEMNANIKATKYSKLKPKSQLRSMWGSISDQGPGQRLHEVMSYLEAVPLERMPESINWAVHVLNKFRTLDPALVPQQSKYNLLARSDSLFYAWRDFMRRQTSKSCWMLHGRLCLIYSCESRHVEPSPTHSLCFPAHDKYRIEEDREIHWPYYDFSFSHPSRDYIVWRRNFNKNL